MTRCSVRFSALAALAALVACAVATPLALAAPAPRAALPRAVGAGRAPACGPVGALTAAGVVLDEILAGPARDWDGSGAFSSRDDEWIEILNSGNSSADLTGFFVTDGDSIARYAFSGTLAPGAVQLVTGKASYDWERANGKPAYGLSLGNSGDSVLLWHVTGTDTVLVDGYTFSSHEAAADRSIGRAVDTGAWTLFDGLDPYTGTAPPLGTGCAPTPGAVNACTTTPARTVTWGQLKTLYH